MRAFRHKSTLIQAAGRAMRPYPGKLNCMFLDYTEAFKRHGDLSAPTGLDGRRKREGSSDGVGEYCPPDMRPELTDAALSEWDIGLGGGDGVIVAAEPVPAPVYVDGKEVISRADAIARGLTKFFTGKPCGRGHVECRDVGSMGCRMCALEAHSGRCADPAYRAKLREATRKWDADPTNKARAAEAARRRYADPANRAKAREYGRKWLANPDNKAKANEAKRKCRLHTKSAA